MLRSIYLKVKVYLDWSTLTVLQVRIRSMCDNKVNLWRSSIMLFSFWSSSTQSLCSFSSQIVPVQISQLLLSILFTKLEFMSLSIFNNHQLPGGKSALEHGFVIFFLSWKETTWSIPISWRFTTWSKTTWSKNPISEDRPGTQSLQWPVSPPWSWSSWRGHSPPIHRHTCKLKMK